MTGLALARCGATDRAERLLSDTRLTDRSRSASVELQGDIAALHARLSKDRALAEQGNRRRELASAAADRYDAVAEKFGGHYAIVNAATMALLAGDDATASRRAKHVLSLLPTDPIDYWELVSRAEALLVLGDAASARDALHRAADGDADWSMRATTQRQLRMVCELRDLDPLLLAELRNPSVAHYSGHMFASGPETELRVAIAELLQDRNVGAVYGSLACGADIVIAETALEANVELHVFLPCPEPDFVARSVAIGGTDWIERWQHVTKRATGFTFEPTQAIADDAMFAYCDQQAMGSALLRARQLGTNVFQLAVWDGQPSEGVAGTAAAVERWRGLGGDAVVVPLERADLEPVRSPDHSALPAGRPRRVRAILFADVKGFSELAEQEIPDFFEKVMGGLVGVIDRYGEAVSYRNTWGDALYVVFDEPMPAARCALEIQARLETLRSELGWTELAARIGVHAGPVYDGYDPVRDAPTHYGTHVNRAARIEPRTPPGQVYVSASFAALLALDDSGNELRAEYVGHVPTAKDYGTFPMYLLSP